jgi:hypothetical protein
MAIQTDVSALRATVQKSMMKKMHVCGVGVGYKKTAGKVTDDLSLVVFVREKVAAETLTANDLVPRQLDGIPTDVMRVGKVVAYKLPTSRWRPAPGGVSIGHYAITAGTLGAVVRDAVTNEMLILSNNHVMANSNDALKGDSVLQPGPADGGKDPQDRIGGLERFVKIQYKSSDGDGGSGSGCSWAKTISALLNVLAAFTGSGTKLTPVLAEATNLVDAAVAKPIDGDAVVEEIERIGTVSGTAAAQLGMNVCKSGRTTSLTEGTITVLDTTLDVGYGGGRVATYEHQILTDDMSDPGDSGSLLVDSQNHAVGLLFAGSDEVTVYNPIETVLSLLNIKI